MNNIEILEHLEEMQKTFIEDGLQGYEMVIVKTKNFINSLTQRLKDIEQIEKEHKEENGRLREELENIEYIKRNFDYCLERKTKELEEENRIQRGQLNSAFNNGFIHKDKIKKIIDSYNNTLQCTRKYNEELANILCDLEELLEESEK